jgi:hypothetical protein
MSVTGWPDVRHVTFFCGVMGTQHLVREFNSVKTIFSDRDLISIVKNHYLQIFNFLVTAFQRGRLPEWERLPSSYSAFYRETIDTHWFFSQRKLNWK